MKSLRELKAAPEIHVGSLIMDTRTNMVGIVTEMNHSTCDVTIVSPEEESGELDTWITDEVVLFEGRLILWNE